MRYEQCRSTMPYVPLTGIGITDVCTQIKFNVISPNVPSQIKLAPHSETFPISVPSKLFHVLTDSENPHKSSSSSDSTYQTSKTTKVH